MTAECTLFLNVRSTVAYRCLSCCIVSVIVITHDNIQWVSQFRSRNCETILSVCGHKSNEVGRPTWTNSFCHVRVTRNSLVLLRHQCHHHKLDWPRKCSWQDHETTSCDVQSRKTTSRSHSGPHGTASGCQGKNWSPPRQQATVETSTWPASPSVDATTGSRHRTHRWCRLGHSQWSSSMEGTMTHRRSSGPMSEWMKECACKVVWCFNVDVAGVQGWRGNNTEDNCDKAFTWAGGPASRNAGRPRVWEGSEKQGWETETRPRRSMHTFVSSELY